MSENFEFEVEELDLSQSQHMRLMNPNDKTYETNFGGAPLYFEPNKIYKVKHDDGRCILNNATRCWEDMKIQQNSEREMYYKYLGSMRPDVRDQARKFASMIDGRLVTVTQAPKYQWLVDIDSTDGKSIIEKSRTEKQEQPRQTEQERIVVAHQDVMDEVLSPTKEIELVKPKEDWELTKIRDYLKDSNVPVSNFELRKGQEDKLLKKALAIFASKCDLLDQAGVKYRIL